MCHSRITMAYSFDAVYDSARAPERRLLMRVLETRRDDIVRRHLGTMQRTSAFMVNYYCAVRVETVRNQESWRPHYKITMSIDKAMLNGLGRPEPATRMRPKKLKMSQQRSPAMSAEEVQRLSDLKEEQKRLASIELVRQRVSLLLQ